MDAYIADCAAWKKIARAEPPCPVLQSFDPHYFHPVAFHAVQGMLVGERMYAGVASFFAFSASSLFGTDVRVLQYLEKWGTATPRPLQDIICRIKLPEKRTPEMDLKAWGDAVLKCEPSMAQLVAFADRIPVPEKSDDGRTWSMQKTREKAAHPASPRKYSGYRDSHQQITLWQRKKRRGPGSL